MKKKVQKLYPTYAFTMFAFVVMELQRMLAGGTLSREALNNLVFRTFLSAAMVQTLSTRTEISQALNSAGWFLSCIMILYLVTPFVFRGLQKAGGRMLSKGILLFVICFAMSASFYCLWEKNPQQTGLFYCTPYIRIFHYLLGVSAGIVFTNIRFAIPDRVFDVLETALLIFNGYVWLVRDWGTVPNGLMQLLAAVLTVFIFAHEKGFISKWLKGSWIIRLEDLCFDFYLLHYTVIALINNYYMPQVTRMTDTHMACLCFAAFLISGGLSYLSVRLQSGFKRKSVK